MKFSHLLQQLNTLKVRVIKETKCAFAGVKTVLVSLMAQKAEVKFDPAYIMPSQIANRISELGYSTTVMENETAGQNTVELKVNMLRVCTCIHGLILRT